jgi:two-component system, cell cycle sensor histidine kinase and response regulator CckA
MCGEVVRADRTGWEQGDERETRTGAETVLLVEDEVFVREVTGEVLRSAGYRVLSAQNSTEATDLHERHGDKIDLLISDVVLPGENGRELAGKLQERVPRMKVLFVTGYIEHMGTRPQKPMDCLAKPFSSRALLERVRQVLDYESGQRREKGLLRRVCGNGQPGGSVSEFETAEPRA